MKHWIIIAAVAVGAAAVAVNQGLDVLERRDARVQEQAEKTQLDRQNQQAIANAINQLNQRVSSLEGKPINTPAARTEAKAGSPENADQ